MYKHNKLCYFNIITTTTTTTTTKKMKLQYKGFTIEGEYAGDPQVDITISKTIRRKHFSGSIALAENEGLQDYNWTETLVVPEEVLEKAYDLEDKMLEKLGQ